MTMSFFSLLFFGGPEKGRLVLLNISCCKIKLTEVQLFHKKFNWILVYC